MSEEKAKFSISDQSHGAHFIMQHTQRPMVIYPITKSEMRSLALFNAATTFFVSAGTGLLFFMFGFMVDVAKEPDAVTVPQVVTAVYWGCFILAIGFYALAIGAFWWRRSTLQDILDESRKPQRRSQVGGDLSR